MVVVYCWRREFSATLGEQHRQKNAAHRAVFYGAIPAG